MSKYVENKIKELQQATGTLQQQVAAQQIDETAYNESRVEINVLLIEIALGAEFTSKKDGTFAVKFGKPLPTKEELAMAYTIIDAFAKSVEDTAATDDEDDMQIPINIGNQLPAVEKITAKSLKNIIFGGDGTTSILQIRLNGNDFIELSVWGEKLHKRQMFWTWIIVGASSAVAIGGGITAGILISNYNKKKAAVADTEVVEIETAEVIDDIPDEVDLDADLEAADELY